MSREYLIYHDPAEILQFCTILRTMPYSKEEGFYITITQIGWY